MKQHEPPAGRKSAIECGDPAGIGEGMRVAAVTIEDDGSGAAELHIRIAVAYDGGSDASRLR